MTSSKAKVFLGLKKREVHYRFSEDFRLTSAHEFLHIFLYELNPNVPLRLEEGVCRINEGKRKNFKGKDYQIMYYQLVKFVPEERWGVQEVFLDYYTGDNEGNVAAAFVLYAMEELGIEKFWDFYLELNKENWKVMLKKHFRKDLATIEGEFQAFVRTIPDPPEAFNFKNSPESEPRHK